MVSNMRLHISTFQTMRQGSCQVENSTSDHKSGTWHHRNFSIQCPITPAWPQSPADSQTRPLGPTQCATQSMAATPTHKHKRKHRRRTNTPHPPTHPPRQTDRQTDKPAVRQTHRQTQAQRQRQRQRQRRKRRRRRRRRGRPRRGRQTDRQTDRQADRHTDTRTHRHTHTHTDTQTHRHTDTHTHTHRHTDAKTHRHADTQTQTGTPHTRNLALASQRPTCASLSRQAWDKSQAFPTGVFSRKHLPASSVPALVFV